MRDTWASRESWVYECLNCLTTWAEEFQVTHTADGHGGEVVAYSHEGYPCTTPWADHVCPNCRCQNVTTFPATRRRRQAEAHPQGADDLELVFRLRRLHAW
ncbi:hypothetical protein Arub01_02770 [Actinomadura rubrobrunea]|uniref:C2H2-type domain-containing protein n=1 Tax=Actinomadura rubrobrunea TaxID=115335 RepID=A0A9W6PS86_9ACTN|nr:hypothetical protein [Actinomadura rubrobrunea]GLW62033.1 hypothetical protein Arub01_02770 [Actinomadura rubrobrunea]